MSLVPAMTGVSTPLPIANTAPTPANGEPVRAEDVQDAVQALLNQDKSLETAMPHLSVKVAQAANYTVATDNAYHDVSNPHLDFASTKIGDVFTIVLGAMVTTTEGYLDLGICDDYGGTPAYQQINVAAWTSPETELPLTVCATFTAAKAGTTRVVVRLKTSLTGALEFMPASVQCAGSLMATRIRVGN